MEKFALLTEWLRHLGIATPTNLIRPGKARTDVLSTAHCSDYIRRFSQNQLTSQELRRMGLPWSEGLVKRTLISPNGTLMAAHLALQHGIACHLAGGTHHAHYDFASGFCIINDLAVTAATLLAQGKVGKVLIFDCDVHQGDGTASILANETGAYTCSIHCDKNFPARKAKSDLDVSLAPNTTDADYIATVDTHLQQLLDDERPELVLYDAGVDIYTHDPLGLLNVSEQGICERDHLVLKHCRDKGIPVATVIGGGYDDDRKALAKRHAFVVEEAHKLFAQG
ncbi:histone deacetylase [Gilvimarinus sp. SDUM040013]|uniref:Histone deacetylase n=1 Tax=Gilvimarinus gilvus TaxID=3058038 RepID=A0ABU4S0I8_9GAMM|nr:histone deacetylase [Gilvimarinus sp. SDUM040013]MDO3385885.1 histone deacetylase [Gilvimarinus sp. SDUM040013]MDX6850612.1 histone deacetylase [Gilvimarinus sp. SDUM040013]